MQLTDNSTDDIFNHWKRVMPKYEPRQSQIDVFNWLQDLSPDKKYMFVEMPVGGGKSPVGLTVSSWLSKSGRGSSFILTPQKILQRQYEDSFDDHLLASMYGKVNYPCVEKDCTCEVGSSIKPPCDPCPYKWAFAKSISSPNMVLNYTLALLYFAYLDSKKLPPRSLMVMDECHNLEQQLVNFSEFTISNINCQKIGGDKFKYYAPKTMADAHSWIIEEYWPKLQNYIIHLDNEIQRIESYTETNKKLSATDQAIIKNYIRYSRHAVNVQRVLLVPEEDIERQNVLIPDKDKFVIKELFGGRVFHQILKPMAGKFLFMSSTILNLKGFCKDLNINPDEAAFISLDSEFDKERRRVIYAPIARMNFGWDKNERKRILARGNMASMVNDLLIHHSNDSGIIHTGSYKMSRWLVDELQKNNTHLILNHNPDNNGDTVKREDIIKEYMESTQYRPTLLVSPSITEGLDLKHELGRFAIFVKVPFPALGDAWIKRRMQLSDEWYKRQTLKEMIQGSGRICRDHSDWGITYILDESFTFLFEKTKDTMIPQWWLSSLEM
jgi:Rad3-related DNA helicase